MGSCLSTKRKDNVPDRVHRIQESPKKGSTPMVIDGSMKYDHLLLGKSPTDTYERDQDHLRNIISRAAKEFIDIGSAQPNSFQVHNSHLSGTIRTLVPQEAMNIFKLPKSHQNQSLSTILSEPVLSDFNFVLEASESIAIAISDMRVEYVGEIVASFPII